MNDEVRALTRQGIDLAHQGRLPEAVAVFEDVLRLNPQFGSGYNNLANVFLFQGRYEEAIANYRLALQLLPHDPGIYSHLSYAFCKKGSGKDAETWARHALALQPTFAEAHNHLGIALGLQERFTDAECSFREALRHKPDFPKALANLAQLYFLERRLDEAITHAQHAIRVDPQQAEAYATLGAVYINQRRLEEALSCCRHALQLNPLLPEAHFNLATVHVEKGQLEEAAAICRETLRLRPDYFDMEIILGMVALKENRLDDALVSFNTVLRHKPEEPLVHFNRAVTWLMQGNYEQGWPEYEWRWRWKDYVLQPFPKPVWDGSSLAGKTILLHAEQGLGDTLHFIRYAPLVKQKGGTVIVACQNILLRLLSRCAGIDQLVSQETYNKQADEHAPLMSLPGILKTTLATIPATVPYLFPDPTLVDQWREEWTSVPGLKIGIAWQGNPIQKDDRFRSIPLTEFAPLGQVPGNHWFALQKDHGQGQLAKAPFNIVDLSHRLNDFADTAAVLMNLDLFITSDSAIAHLAGGLGVPVWLALQFAPDCRWFLERVDSPWYPTMRLFRQRRRGDWQRVFEQMAIELAAHVMKHEETKNVRI